MHPARSLASSGRFPVLHLPVRLAVLCFLLIGTLGWRPAAHAAGGVLQVLHTTPPAGATGVPATGFISITFNRPVVTLGDVGTAGVKPAARITPPVTGTGRWINPSTWAFQMPGGLVPATRYTVTPLAGLTGQDGSVLRAAPPYHFETLRPGVLSVTPAPGTAYVLPHDAVQLVFNQPVRRASAEQAFQLLVNGAPVTGRFGWNGPVLATQPNGANAAVPPASSGQGPGTPPPAKDTVLTFSPRSPLPLGASVEAVLRPGVQGTAGPLGMAAPYNWRYTIAGPLSITGSTPARGATGVNAGQGVQITLSAPISQALLQSAVRITPRLDYTYLSLNDAGTVLTVSGDFQPSTSYTISIATQPIGTAGQRLHATYHLGFSTQPAQPSIQLVNQGEAVVDDAYLDAAIYARVTNVPSVALSVYRLTPSQFLGLMYRPPNNWQGAPPAGAPLAASYYVPSRAPLNKTLLVKQPLTRGGRPLGPGYYLVDAGAGGTAGDHLLVLITRTSVTLKIGQQQAFVWATDLRTGKPVSGEAVRIVDAGGRVWASGTTGPDGVFQASVTGLKSGDSLLQHALQAQLSHGSDVAACGLDWNNGVGPWDYNLPFTTYLQPVRIYLTTDRPIYRPGQPVYFTGLARHDHDGRYTLLAPGTPVQVTIQDSRQTVVYNGRLHAGAYSAFSGTLPLNSAAGLGTYTLTAGIGSSTDTITFQVAEYQKPSYAVSVISDRGANANYLQGQTIGVQVRANYYFGAPLAHAPVQWDLTRDNYFFSSPLFPEYDFVDSDLAAIQQQTFFGQQVTQGTGRTDARGDFHFNVPANIAQDPLSQQFTLEAILTGPDGTQVAQRTQVVVHKAAVYVGMRPAQYLGTAGKPSTIRVVTVSVNGIKTVGSVPVVARVYKRAYYSSYVRDASGYYYYQSSFKDTLVATEPVRTDAQGRAVVSFTPATGGEYRIAATATDAAGRTATTATYLWVVSGSGQYVPWQVQNNDRMTLVADRKIYQPGQTAHLLVTAPLAGMTALVTVERGGVLTHFVTTLKTNSAQIAIPIRGLYAPDVYVSVVAVKGPGADSAAPVWRMGYVALPVDTSARTLHITLTASVPKASPGERVTFHIHAADAQGHGVQAQLAVALIDKAVLALATSTNPSLLDTFYQARDLGVESAGSLTLALDQFTLNQKVGAKGGSGGGGGGQGPVRTRFPDTAYWNPSVVTNAQGNATVSVVLPGNLTTWTLSAAGGTTGTLVGAQALDLISSKDLLLEPALPSFLTLGDVASGGAVVDNLTMVSRQVRVTLHTSGAGAPADYTTAVQVSAGGSQLVQWPIHAQAVGTATFLFSAQAVGTPSLNDRLQISLPIQPNTAPQVQATSGVFQGNLTQTVQVPAGAVPDVGGLTVTLAPSLVSGLGGAADFLLSYPYDSAEQSAGRSYGLIEVLRLPASVSGVSAATAAQAPILVQTELQRLYSAQNTDGGWGWWPDDPSSPYITGYVLEALTALRGRNYPVDPRVFSQGVSYLHGWAVNPPAPQYLPDATSTLDLQAYSAYIVGEAGTPDSGLINALYAHYQNMLPFARAYLALAAARVGGRSDVRVRSLLASVEGAAQQFGSQAHWSDRAPDWLMMDDDVSATAIVLDTLVRLDPANPLIPGAARWLLARRVDGTWSTTQSTARVLRAFADYAVAHPPSSGTSRYTIAVNGKVLGSGTITDATRGMLRTVTVPVQTLGRNARVSLAVHGGSGQMAYAIALHVYMPVTTTPPQNHGILVTRRYEPIGGHGRAGSQVRVVLTLTAPEDLYYLSIQDPIPAGAEPVDPSLQTTSVLSTITSQSTIPQGTTNLAWYISQVEFFDDRTVLFADYLPAGVYQYSYQIHLVSAGTYHALPTQAQLLYFPDVWGAGAGSLYTIPAH